MDISENESQITIASPNGPVNSSGFFETHIIDKCERSILEYRHKL